MSSSTPFPKKSASKPAALRRPKNGAYTGERLDNLTMANLAAIRNSWHLTSQDVVDAMIAVSRQDKQPLINSASSAVVRFPQQQADKSRSGKESTAESQSPLSAKAIESIQAQEVLIARRFNFDLPEESVAAVESLEQAVKDLTGCQKVAILVFDELTGVYTCLSDEKYRTPNKKPRELTRISDGFLQSLLGDSDKAAKEVIHSHMLLGGDLIGLVAVANKQNNRKTDATAFGVDDEITLELLAPYLATKICRYKAQKQAQILPFKQEILIELSTRLVSAVDQESIISETLDLFWSRLGFGACQFVASPEYMGPEFNPPDYQPCGEGVVLFEQVNGRVNSMTHAGLASQRHVVKDFSAIISLLASGWRKQHYLLISADHLGDKPLTEIFGLKKACAVLMVPVIDMQTGKIQGTLNLFQTRPAEITQTSIELAMTISQLVSNALGRSKVLEKALAMATLDELTGILNRRGLYERFGSEIERARRHPAPMTLALIDVDFFKKFNDTYGHLSGDLILKAVGQMLASSVRKSDIVCRFGGEEFAILLPETPLPAARDLLERLRKKIEAMQVLGYNQELLQVTVSIGLSPVNFNPGDLSSSADSDENHYLQIASQALAAADEALYEAKSRGRNQVCICD